MSGKDLIHARSTLWGNSRLSRSDKIFGMTISQHKLFIQWVTRHASPVTIFLCGFPCHHMNVLIALPWRLPPLVLDDHTPPCNCTPPTLCDHLPWDVLPLSFQHRVSDPGLHDALRPVEKHRRKVDSHHRRRCSSGTAWGPAGLRKSWA